MTPAIGERIKKLTSVFFSVFIISTSLFNGSCDLILQAAVRAAGGCQKDFTSFSFTASLNNGTGLTTDCVGIITGTNISLTVPYGTSVAALVATFTATGVEVRVGSIVQVSGLTVNNFTNPVTYTVAAADSSTKTYTVTVISAASSSKDITSFCFIESLNNGTGLTTDCVGIITGNNISLTVPYGTSVIALVASFTATGVQVKVGSTTQVSGVTHNDFTNPVTYLVVAADLTTKNYTVLVNVAANPAKDITAFFFSAALNSGAGLTSDCVGIINGTNILVTVPDSVSVTSLVATFTTTGKEVKVGSTVQVNGTTPNDFTNPVTYVVIAEDSTTKSYDVRVSKWETVGLAGFSAGPVGPVSLALDSSNTPYVAFRDGAKGNKATVMKYEGGSWQIVGVAGFSAALAEYISLALDSSGNKYVAYQDAAYTEKATVMKYDGGSWQCVGTMGFSAWRVYYISLGFDSSNTPYVAFRDGANSCKATVMKYEGGSWQTVGVAGFSESDAIYNSLAVDVSGTPYVAFSDGANSYKATVMKYEGGSWQIVGAAGFSPAVAEYVSLALNSSSTPYVAYIDTANSLRATVMKYDSGSWHTVGAAGFSAGEVWYTSLELDSSDTPYVTYKDLANDGKATVMRYENGSWKTVGEAGFSAGAVATVSLALDSLDTPYVAFPDMPNGKATVMKLKK